MSLKGIPEYRIWCGMRERCRNPRGPSWRYYGGRGITVCARWDQNGGYAHFIRDMGPRPSPKHSIDRINNDGDYTPENCRWATPKQQARNTSGNRILTIGGVSRPLVEWAERAGLPYQTVMNRLIYGWSPEKAVSTPDRPAPRMKFQIGQRFGDWTIVQETPKRWNRRHFLCRCVCGMHRVVNGSTLRNGRSKGCRCRAYKKAQNRRAP